jgi:hypothetical protein
MATDVPLRITIKPDQMKLVVWGCGMRSEKVERPNSHKAVSLRFDFHAG